MDTGQMTQKCSRAVLEFHSDLGSPDDSKGFVFPRGNHGRSHLSEDFDGATLAGIRESTRIAV
jgi:hypothetical protein